MRRSRRGDHPADLPIHRWAREHEYDHDRGDVRDVTDWVAQLRKRGEKRGQTARERELPIELHEFLDKQRRGWPDNPSPDHSSASG